MSTPAALREGHGEFAAGEGLEVDHLGPSDLETRPSVLFSGCRILPISNARVLH